MASLMDELVCGAGMVELVCWREVSSEFIFFSRRDNAMATKLPLSGHPCASPLHCWKCWYVPLSVLYEHLFGSLYI